MGTVNPFMVGIDATVGADPATNTVTAPSGGGGLESTLSNLFQNKLFLQFLGGLGKGMAEPRGGVAKELNANLQQNIANQNAIKLYTKMLSGDIPEGGKVVHSDTGTVVHMPKSALDTVGGMAPASTPAPAPTQATQATTPQAVAPVNPFVPSQGFNPSDLAGLTPEMISGALQMKMQQDALRNKSVQDMIDQGFKERQLGLEARRVAVDELHNQALINKGPEPVDQLSPYISPGVNNGKPLTNRQFAELTPEEKNYSIYATALGPDVKPMGRKEFSTLTPTSQLQFLHELMNDPKAMAAEKSLRESSAIKLPPAVQSFETAKGSQKAFITGPEFVTSTIEDVKKSLGYKWDDPTPEELKASTGSDDPENKLLYRKIKIMEAMDQKIKSVFRGAVRKRAENGKPAGWYDGDNLIAEIPR